MNLVQSDKFAGTFDGISVQFTKSAVIWLALVYTKIKEANIPRCRLQDGYEYWRLDYRFRCKRKTPVLSVYPDVSLKDAREKRRHIRHQWINGVHICICMVLLAVLLKKQDFMEQLRMP